MTDRNSDPDRALGPEWDALELLCTGRADELPEALAGVLGRPDLSWGELIEQALRHQMLALLSFHVLALSDEHGLRVPGRVANHLAEVLDLNRWRLQVFRHEAARVADALRDLGVPFVGTKGITFESTIYGGQGTRTLKDIDFMIAPDAREAVSAALERLGYQPGDYDQATGTIVPLARRQELIYALNPDHLPRHARLATEPGVRYLYVDFANSLTWSKSRYEVPVDEALRHTVDLPLAGVPSGTLPSFRPDFQFLFTVLHLFREAWHEQWLELEVDVSLMKFGDVIRLFSAHRAELGQGRLADLLDGFGVAEPVAWVLEHTDRTFGTAMVAELGLDGRVDESWLGQAGPSYGQDRRWEGTMRARLWAKDRQRLFRVSDPAPTQS